MTLQSLIQSGNYDSPQSAYDAITSPSIEVRDDALYTWAGVALVGGPVAAESLRIALEQNGMGWAVHQLGGAGLQLSNPLVQGALLQLAQAGVPGCAELAATGISFVAPYQQAGIDKPTLEEVTTEWNAWKAETDLANLRDSLRIRFDAILNQVGTDEQPQAVAELRLIADELEA
jgi:hypothetical protein